MKKISAKDIGDNLVNYIEFKLPLIGEYWNASRFVELFKLEASLMCAERDEMTGEQVYLVRMQNKAFKKSKMSYDEIKEVIANTFNICCDEHNEEKRKKEEDDNKKLSNFITNGFNHENLLSLDLSKQYPLHELQECIKEFEDDAKSTTDKELKLSWYMDAQDVLEILYHLRKWEIEEACKLARNLDTCVRERIPDSVWSLLGD